VAKTLPGTLARSVVRRVADSAVVARRAQEADALQLDVVDAGADRERGAPARDRPVTRAS